MNRYFAFLLAAVFAVAVFTHIPPTDSGAAVPRPTQSYAGTLDVANLIDGAGVTHTIVASSARLGDHCLASMGVSVAGITVTCFVSATRVVSVRFQNETAGAIDLASTTLRVLVFRLDPLAVAGVTA